MAHPDGSIRENTNDYVKSVVNMAAEVGALVLTITPTPWMKTQPLTTHEVELKWNVEGIQAAAELAEVHNVTPRLVIKCGDSLFQFHLADSNRAAHGTAHLDFLPVIQALKAINYQGYLAYEILPAAADPFGVIRRVVCEEFLDKNADQCITYIKSIEASLK